MEMAAVNPPYDLQEQALDVVWVWGAAGWCFQHGIQVATQVTVEGFKYEVEAIPLPVDIEQLGWWRATGSLLPNNGRIFGSCSCCHVSSAIWLLHIPPTYLYDVVVAHAAQKGDLAHGVPRDALVGRIQSQALDGNCAASADILGTVDNTKPVSMCACHHIPPCKTPPR